MWPRATIAILSGLLLTGSLTSAAANNNTSLLTDTTFPLKTSSALQETVSNSPSKNRNKKARPKSSDLGGTPIKFATYNICKMTCSDRYSWQTRRARVARNIIAADADVVAVQEATTDDFRGKDHWQDLAALLKSGGYTVAYDEVGNCSKFGTAGGGDGNHIQRGKPCTKGSHLFYKADVVEPVSYTGPTDFPAPTAQCAKYEGRAMPGLFIDLDKETKVYWRDYVDFDCEDFIGWAPVQTRSAGLVSTKSLTPNTQWGGVLDRYFAWGYFRHKSSGARFLAMSVHLPSDRKITQNKPPQAIEQMRLDSADAIARWADQRNTIFGVSALPTIIMGDLNSFAARQPNGAQKHFADAGYVDTFTAEKKVNKAFATVNSNKATQQYKGFPPKAFHYKYNGVGTRIDYILAKNAETSLRWEIFLQLHKGFMFDEDYRGSDHNLVRATAQIPTR